MATAILTSVLRPMMAENGSLLSLVIGSICQPGPPPRWRLSGDRRAPVIRSERPQPMPPRPSAQTSAPASDGAAFVYKIRCRRFECASYLDRRGGRAIGLRNNPTFRRNGRGNDPRAARCNNSARCPTNRQIRRNNRMARPAGDLLKPVLKRAIIPLRNRPFVKYTRCRHPRPAALMQSATISSAVLGVDRYQLPQSNSQRAHHSR